MAYTANSIIEIFSGIKLNKDSEDTIYFGTREAQNTYFSDITKVNRVFRETDYQFIRAERESIRVHANYGIIQNCNYLRFKNPNYGDKWYYAFVTNSNYINDDCTEIEFEIDPLQTWLAGIDYELNDCFIIRQHQTGSDNIGDNTQPENIQSITTKYTRNTEYDPFYDGTTPNFYFAVLMDNSPDININVSPRNSKFISRTYVDASLLLFDANNPTAVDNLKTLFNGSGTNAGVSSEFIIAIYTIPKIFINANDIVQNAYDVGTGSTIWFQCDSVSTNIEPKKQAWIPIVSLTAIPDGSSEGYNPVNKKVFTYPYCWYDILNPDGKHLELCYEWINNPNETHNPIIEIFGGLLPTNKIVAMPKNYKWTNISSDDVISIPQIPVGIFNNNEYKRALQGLVPSIISIAGGVALGGIGGAGLISEGGNLLSEASRQSHPQRTGDFNEASTAFANNQLKLEGRQAYPENFKEIDAYFSAYGYSQNKFATPDITHRAQWTYVQTRGANFKPISITANAMKQINDKFNSGVRFHVEDSTIGSMYTFDQTLQKYVLKTNAIIS